MSMCSVCVCVCVIIRDDRDGSERVESTELTLTPEGSGPMERTNSGRYLNPDTSASKAHAINHYNINAWHRVGAQ